MKDTPLVIERKFHEMLMKRSGEERLKMGCSMHATAQALARASLRQRYRNALPGQLKRLLFLYFYAADFEPEKRKRITAALARRSQPRKGLQKIKPTVRKPLDRINFPIANPSDSVRDKAEAYGRTGGNKGRPSRQGRR